uniref:Uncharacterized protein n=1 Tax=Hucho hucho TaxID=62062 RepID=A0A4W5PZU2_9TELE
MPSNTVATTTNTAAFKNSDYTCDAPGNRMSESALLDKELAPEEKAAKSNASCTGVRSAGRKRKQIPVEGSVSVKESVVGGGCNSRTGLVAERERQSVAQVHNGVVSSGHADRDRTQAGACCCPKQDRKASEKNGLPGTTGTASAPASRAEDAPPGPYTRSLSPPSLENGFLLSREPSRDEQDDSEKDKEETLPTPPRKKRGRRKLERPTKYVEQKEEDGVDAIKNE